MIIPDVSGPREWIFPARATTDISMTALSPPLRIDVGDKTGGGTLSRPSSFRPTMLIGNWVHRRLYYRGLRLAGSPRFRRRVRDAAERRKTPTCESPSLSVCLSAGDIAVATVSPIPAMSRNDVGEKNADKKRVIRTKDAPPPIASRHPRFRRWINREIYARAVLAGAPLAPEASGDIHARVTSSIIVISSLVMVYKNFMRRCRAASARGR